MVSLRGAYVHRSLVYALSVAGAVAVSVIIVYLSVSGAVKLPFSDPTMVILVTLVFLVFPNFMEFAYQRWRRQIDEAIPNLLTDISAEVKTGISLDRALENAAKKDYGPLQGELKKMLTQMQLGVPFDVAVENLVPEGQDDHDQEDLRPPRPGEQGRW